MMTLITRIARLFRADVNGILDWLEEPEAVLKQAVRDMQSEIETGVQRLAELEQKDNTLKALVEQLRGTVTELQGQIDICFDEDDHDLARTFIRKKLETENRLKVALRTAAAVTAEKEAQQQKISEQKEQLSVVMEKMQLFVQSHAQPSAREPFTAFEAEPVVVSDAEVEIAFLHEKRQRAGNAGKG
jgi:phage shock protein A